jgi:phenylalanyl-tRNA synthetase alpha chain
MKKLTSLSEDERKEAGKVANEAKEKMEGMIAKAKEKLAREEEKTRADREWIDVTAPGIFSSEGHLHPVSQAIQEITDVFAQIGFVSVRAPEIDWDWYVFEALNMPPDHPARDDWETFFVGESKGQKAKGEKGRLVLTPHTSNAQVREMEKGRLPIRMININRTYRRQSDPSHTPMFHQFEGLVVDEGITIANLKGVLDYFAKTFFGPERSIRLRPHHFRFTEPSFEVDISCGACGGKGACRICKAGWLELGGAGMVHPNVLKAGGLDPEKISGFAFGWGVERTLVMKEGTKIDDIRILYKNDLRFAKQF